MHFKQSINEGSIFLGLFFYKYWHKVESGETVTSNICDCVALIYELKEAIINIKNYKQVMDPSSRSLKYKIRRATAILSTLVLSLIIWIWIDIDLLNNLHVQLDSITHQTMAEIACSRICQSQPYEQVGQCCNYPSGSCQQKTECYNRYINDHNTAIQSTENQVNILFIVGLSTFFLLIFLPFIYCYIKHRRMEEQKRTLAELERHFLWEEPEADNTGNYLLDFDQLEQVLEFIRKAESQSLRNANPKIRSSFVTEDGSNNCPICIMALNEEKVLQLGCGHIFHSSCVRDWNQANSVCPVCRANIYDAARQNTIQMPEQQFD